MSCEILAYLEVLLSDCFPSSNKDNWSRITKSIDNSSQIVSICAIVGFFPPKSTGVTTWNPEPSATY